MPRILLFLSLSILLSAQTPDTATIHGRVTDASHAAVAGVAVKVTSAVSDVDRSAQTDGSGNFSITGLPIAGTYTITANKAGFSEARLADVTLAGGTTANLTLQLSVAGSESKVTVTGVPGEVRADSPQLGERLDSRTIQETPLLNNRITYLPLLDAANRQAINQGDVFMNEDLFTTNGAGRRQAWFEVDSVTGNDSWGRQTIFSNIPSSAVQEMNVLENGFSAEYGGSTGSAINIITKSGGNQFHGDVMEVWRPAATEAALSGFSSTNAASGNDITSDTLGQSALALGGPINSTTHFFAAGEFSREDRASPIISPVEPGSFVGHYRGWLAFVRLDHQINDRNNVFYRGDVDGFHDTNPNGIVGGNSLPSVDRVFYRRTYSNELGETAVLSPTLLNAVRVQFQLASPITEFIPAIYSTQYVVPISSGGTFTSGTSQSALLMNRQYQANDTLSATWGKHQIKFGADMIVAHTGGDSKEFGGPIYLGSFTYKSCGAQAGQPLTFCESQAYLGSLANVATYTQSYGNASYTVNDTLWALFVQDDYKIRPDLTLEPGPALRTADLHRFDKLNFAPRVWLRV